MNDFLPSICGKMESNLQLIVFRVMLPYKLYTVSRNADYEFSNIYSTWTEGYYPFLPKFSKNASKSSSEEVVGTAGGAGVGAVRSSNGVGDTVSTAAVGGERTDGRTGAAKECAVTGAGTGAGADRDKRGSLRKGSDKPPLVGFEALFNSIALKISSSAEENFY